MLLTLDCSTYAGRFDSIATHRPGLLEPGEDGRAGVLALPEFAIHHLELRGLYLPASLLRGWSFPDLDALRDAADKAGCPCLVLVEDRPLPFASPDEAARGAATERVQLLARAAHRLGCNALGISVQGPATDAAFDTAVASLKTLMRSIERMELNVLVEPTEGLTAGPDLLIELIKRVGGFRIGSLPTFGHAESTGDLEGALRKLAPYAGGMVATIRGFDKKGKHQGFDPVRCAEIVQSVGFSGTLAIEYRGKGDPTPVVEQARALLLPMADGS